MGIQKWEEPTPAKLLEHFSNITGLTDREIIEQANLGEKDLQRLRKEVV